MSTYLANALRAIHKDPSVENLDNLLGLAIQVQRMEQFVDGLVTDSWSQAKAIAKEKRDQTLARRIVERLEGWGP